MISFRGTSCLISIVLFVAILKANKDSLQQKILFQSYDTTQVNELVVYGDQATSTNIDLAQYVAEKAIHLSDSLSFELGKVKSYALLGYCQIVSGKYHAAIKSYTNAIDLCIGKYENRLPRYYNRKAAAYFYTANYEEAIKQYLNTIEYSLKYNNSYHLVLGYSGLANVYYSQKKYNEAISYYKKALNVESEDLTQSAMLYNNLGNVYLETDKNDTALFYYNKVVDLSQKDADLSSMGLAYLNIGNTYRKMNMYSESINSINNSIDIFKKNNQKNNEILSLINLAYTYESMNELKTAIKYIKEGLVLSNGMEDKKLSEKLFYRAAQVYRANGNHKEAYDYFKKYSDIKDTLINEVNTRSMNELSAKYESDVKEQEIQKLNLANDKKATQRNFLIGFCVIGLIIIIYVFKQSKQKQKINKALEAKNKAIRNQKREIESQSRVLEVQNKEITDSINYALQIQNAIFPKPEFISKNFANHFILYQPKSVVSGDFYFYTETLDKYIFAAVDCTGHGVPGALMSMVGNNLLNQIIIEKNIIEPSVILNKLNKGVQKVLQQDAQSNSRDGMDIALIAFNKEKTKLQYAGANRPLYIVRDKKLIEIKSDKSAIGGYQTDTEKQFTNHELELVKGDTIYLFSDGYADQFGGAKGKKLMVKTLQQLLISIVDFDMNKQKQELASYFTNWKGDNEQIDDVLLIGIKV